MSESKIREKICIFAASIFDRGITHGSTGNISVRLDDDEIFCKRLQTAMIRKGFDAYGAYSIKGAKDLLRDTIPKYAVIDLRWTRKRYPEKSDDFFIRPDEIADEVYHVAHQSRGAWSFDVEIRPHGETW